MARYLTLPNKRTPPVYPTVRITNLTASPLYLGIKAAGFSGIWLAANGQSGDYVDAQGIDFTDKRVVDTLSNFVQWGKVSVAIPAGEDLNSVLNPGTTTTGL